MKLNVISDTTEYEVIVNRVECTYCQTLTHEDEIHIYGDTDMCEACYENMVE